MDPASPDRSYAILRKRDRALFRWLQCAGLACWGTSQLLIDVVSLEIVNPREAQDRVQKVGGFAIIRYTQFR